jgi:hypothetical protein
MSITRSKRISPAAGMRAECCASERFAQPLLL